MNLTSLSQVRVLLKDMDIYPRKMLGQNFLIDKNILDIMIRSLNIDKKDMVLEIGPGLGVLTEQLISRAKYITAIEKDRKLFNFLNHKFRDSTNIKLILADALEVNLDSIFNRGARKVISSLPYSSGNRILVNLIKSGLPPLSIVVMVQHEVAERLMANPCTGNYGVLRLWSEIHYEIKLVKIVSASCFWPKPEVKSAIISMTRHDNYSMTAEEMQFFYCLTKHVFTHRRKQLATILNTAPHFLRLSSESSKKLLRDLDINIKARPEEIGLAGWYRLTRNIFKEKH